MSCRRHHGVSNQSTVTKPRKRTARNVDPSTNSLWMLTMRATVAMAVSPSRNRFGRISPCRFARSARRTAIGSDPWAISWPTTPGIGTRVGPRKARPLTNRAAHAHPIGIAIGRPVGASRVETGAALSWVTTTA